MGNTSSVTSVCKHTDNLLAEGCPWRHTQSQCHSQVKFDSYMWKAGDRLWSTGRAFPWSLLSQKAFGVFQIFTLRWWGPGRTHNSACICSIQQSNYLDEEGLCEQVHVKMPPVEQTSSLSQSEVFSLRFWSRRQCCARPPCDLWTRLVMPSTQW